MKKCDIINNTYEPYYKWTVRGLDDLSILKDLKEELVLLLNLGYSDIDKGIIKNVKDSIYEKKKEFITHIIKKVCEKFVELGYSDYADYKLDHHAYSIVNHIDNIDIRNMQY